MNKILFGISKLCEDILDVEAISLDEVNGLFDNDETKIGQIKYNMCVEKPVFRTETEVILTMRTNHHIEAIRQLLELGYSAVTIIQKTGQGYKRQHFDFSRFCYQQDKDRLIVLYLQHKSYSGISAIEYMVRNYRELVPAGFRIVTMVEKENMEEYYYYAATAAYVITERDNFRAYGKVIQLWHGFPLKALGKMMKGYQMKEGKSQNLWGCYSNIASYGQMYTNFMCACYGTLGSQYWVTGMPRNDLLFVADGKENLHQLMPDAVGKRIVLYMPTFREFEHRATGYMQIDGDENGYIFYWEDFDIDQLNYFCEENQIYFVFKLHPSDASKVKNWCVDSNYIGIMTDEMLDEKCMYEYLNAADVLITDYSSAYFDYLLLNRPMVFTDKDLDIYMEQRGLILEPIDFWRPGVSVHTIQQLEKEIVNALDGNDTYREQRESLVHLVHRYTDGGSTRRLLERIRYDSENMSGEENAKG